VGGAARLSVTDRSNGARVGESRARERVRADLVQLDRTMEIAVGLAAAITAQDPHSSNVPFGLVALVGASCVCCWLVLVFTVYASLRRRLVRCYGALPMEEDDVTYEPRVPARRHSRRHVRPALGAPKRVLSLLPESAPPYEHRMREVPPAFAPTSHLTPGMAGAVVIDERPMTADEAAWFDRGFGQLAGAGVGMGPTGSERLPRRGGCGRYL
jgi:hypothetical protein